MADHALRCPLCKGFIARDPQTHRIHCSQCDLRLSNSDITEYRSYAIAIEKAVERMKAMGRICPVCKNDPDTRPICSACHPIEYDPIFQQHYFMIKGRLYEKSIEMAEPKDYHWKEYYKGNNF